VSIQWRLTLFNAGAIGVILVLLGTGMFLVLRETLLSNVENTLQSQAESAARDLEVYESSSGAPEVGLEEEVAEQLSLNGVYVLVRAHDGRVLYRSVSLPAAVESRDTLWREVVRTGEPASDTAPLSLEAPDYLHAIPIRHENGPLLVLEAGRSYEPVNETLGTIAATLAAGISVAFLLSIGGAYLLARIALRPVDAVVSSAREMSETDLSRRLPVANPNDEIGRLTSTINGLLARLETAFVRREEALTRQRRFAADASHELRTPLTAISGHANMLDQWALEDQETARKSVKIIKKESERLHILAEALLTLARGDEGLSLRVMRHDLREVAAEAVEAARAAAGGKVSIEYASPERAVRATFDRDRIRQVASALLDNAVKYTPEGGRVTVRVGERDSRVFLEVSDTGVGIPEDKLLLIFERFYRLDPSRTEGGAGLGLSIARQIAEDHGGTIEARSEPGRGSAFTLLLPGKAGRSGTTAPS
jgi:two-component system OmpR family sensor kinase